MRSALALACLFSLSAFATPLTAVDASYLHRRTPYTLEHKHSGQNFFDGWEFFSDADPTNGNVNYLSQEDAFSQGLAYVQDDDTVILAVDNTTTVPAGGKRNSIRINSKETFNGGLFITDFFAMPHGCSVWPAYWTTNQDVWPNGGEVDLIEGVNLNDKNQITVHTGGNCSLSSSTLVESKVLDSKCQTTAASNAGCAYEVDDASSFGHGFNMQAGGVLAHLWDDTGITVWWIPRVQITQDIAEYRPDPSTWGAPVAVFPSDQSCDVRQEFFNHTIILDITLCGDWAGNAYAGSGCPGACADQIADPANFDYARWMISYVAVYQ